MNNTPKSEIQTWDYALFNLRRFTFIKGISSTRLATLYRKSKAVCTGAALEPMSYSQARRMRRLITGDTKLSLLDISIFSNALDVPPQDLSFMKPEDFEKKYIDPIKDSARKVKPKKKEWTRPKNI